MDKKGFTLIELLVTIAIMTLIATILTLNVLNIFDHQKKVADENKDRIMMSAASVYLELNENKDLKETCKTHGCKIPVKTLIYAGLLNEEDVDKNQVIHIYYENQIQKVEIN